VAQASVASLAGKRLYAARWCYLFMLPSFGLAILFTFWPIAASWFFSLLDWSGLSNERPFVGLDNYFELIGDAYFWQAFARSFLFMAVTVPVRLGLALLVAIVLNDPALRLAPFFRTLFFLPVVTTSAIVGLLMVFVLSPFNGPINTALVGSGLAGQPIDFLGDPATALWSIMGVTVWKQFGISMVYWLAALQTVPADQVDAARIDGAGSWQVVRYITLPHLRPFAIVIVLITAVGALRVFDLVQTMTGGGPFFSSEVMEVYIYRNAFSVQGGTPRLGYASAAGVFFGLSVMVIALSQAHVLRWARRQRADAAGVFQT
jgi:ABC-type sugar transport system permease subunit